MVPGEESRRIGRIIGGWMWESRWRTRKLERSRKEKSNSR
jgi:hypothetical protein